MSRASIRTYIGRHAWLKFWVAALLGVTVLLLLWHRFGMNRSMQIEVSEDMPYPVSVHDDRDRGGNSVASLEKRPDGLLLSCQYNRQYAWPFCDFAIQLSGNGNGVDLSRFDRIELDVQTFGEGVQPVRVFLRNHDPVYTRPENAMSLKPNGLQYIPKEEENPIRMPLSHFQVASWWIDELRVSPENAGLDISNVTKLEIATGGTMKDGLHQVLVRRIGFHGKWVSQNSLLFFILSLWAFSALYYLVISFWQTRKEVQEVRRQKQQLESVNAALELERRELKVLAVHDPLTGAYNRVGLRDRLFEQVSKLQKGKTELSVIFMDLDHFKQVNDEYGHDTGDRVLRRFADFIRHNTRGEDTLCRWGGEEFVLLCPATHLRAVTGLAEKLRAAIREQAWPQNLAITCSFGVAQMRPTEAISDFLKRVDRALYRAKQAGRDQVVVSDGVEDEVKIA